RISDSLSQENKQNSKNPQENLKNSNIDKTFKIKWLSEFSWLRYDDKKMFCTICVKHKIKNKFATEDHIEAEKLETAHIQMESLQNQIFSSDANARHIIIIMRVVYFLSKKDLPLRLLPSIIKIMKESETPHISDGSITYTNKISEHEFLMVITKTIEDKIWSELSDAVAFGIMIDESTDIITTKHLDVYALYIAKNRTFKTHFLCLLPLTDCDAETFASDGASVMLGKDEGVAVKLSRVCTYPLIVNHYVAYRLALACKDVRKEIEIYKEAELLVKKIYGSFKNSCSHIQQLKEIQNLLDCSILKIKRLYEIQHVIRLSKFLQKRNLQLSDIDLMIQSTINSIQKEYLINNQSQKFGYNLQKFINETNPFGNNSIEYMGHELSFTEQNYDELLIDIYIYLTKWLRDSKDLLCFSDNELEDLLKYYDVEYKRGFSRQNQIKTKNRNSLATAILDMLIRVSLEGSESSKFDYDHAYIIWKSQKRRT
ncbi:13756_t:CDS:2, partial [Funneliformis geosporum]